MTFAARVALLCALLPATLGSAGSGELAHLLDRMRAAAGPVWSTHFVSISRLNVGTESTVVATDGSGPRFTLRRCSGELCEGTYFDGYRLYSLNINGTALPESRDAESYLRSLRLVASLSFLAPDFAGNGRRVEDGGMATLGGKRYRSIFVVDPDSIPMQLYVDPESALVKYAHDVNGDDTFEYRDYRRIDGFTVPFEVLHNGDVLERYDDRTPVSTAFHPPHGPIPVFAGPPEAIATEPNKASPIFTCELAGISQHCLLDTGNSGVSISSELAAELAAPVVGTFSVRGLGGYQTPVVRAGPLRIGNATFPEAYYVVLNDIRKYGYDVVIGADVLGNTGVEIDSAKNTMRLGAVPPPNSVGIPLSFQNFIPVVKVQLGTLDAQLAVDTGDESNINLGYDFYLKHPGLFTVTDRRQVGGVGGSGLELIGEIPSVTIGDYTATKQQIGTTQTLNGTASGHVGAGFLDHFKVLLDYAGGELHLMPLH